MLNYKTRCTFSKDFKIRTIKFLIDSQRPLTAVTRDRNILCSWRKLNFTNRFSQFAIRILFTLVVSIVAMLSSGQAYANSSQTENNTATRNTFPEILYKYFPSRMHAFIWRNWESVPLDRMAKVLNTTTENVFKVGRSMGLPPDREPGLEFEQRGYIYH